PSAPIIEDCVSDSEDESETNDQNDPQSVLSFVQSSEQVKAPRHSIQPSKPVSITAARPVCAALPKIMVTRPRHAHSINTKSKSPIRQHITHSKSPKTSNLPPRVTAVKASVVSAAQDQTVSGKDNSNSLMADNLPKIVWYSTHHVTLNKELTSPKENASWANGNCAVGLKVVAVVEDVQDQSIPSPTPPTPPPQPPQDIPSTSQEALDACVALTRRVEYLEHDKVAQDLEITKLKTRVKKLERDNKVKTLKLMRLRKVGTSQRVDTSDDTIMKDVSNQGRMIDELDRDEGVTLMGEKEEEKKAEKVKDIAGDAQVEGKEAEIQAEIYQIDMDHPLKVLSMQEDEPEVQEIVEVVTTAKLITEVVTAASTLVSAASTIIPTAKPKVPAATITAALVKVAAASTRRRRGVAKEDPYVQRYQVMKKRPQTEAQARRNMIMYLKNTAGFRLDYFKGMSYDDIRPIYKAKFNLNMEFLLKSNEQMEEEENRAIESINETLAQKAAKRKK
nr:hypothetical protein [Tanacetum cinerariifolium]